MKFISINPRQFLHSNEGATFGFNFNRGILFTGYDSSTFQAFCYYVKEETCSESDIRALSDKLTDEKFSYEHTTLKIIAPIRLHDSIGNMFIKNHWQQPKFVNSEDVYGQIYFYGENGRLRIAANQEEEVSVIFQKKIRVLIVDDSPTIHQLLTKIFSTSPNIQVVGAVEDPFKAEDAIRTLKPDVLTVDINMDKMDGVTLLKKIFASKRIPALLVSSMGIKDGPQVMAGLAAGAVDYVQKPTFEKLNEFADEIIEKVRMASTVNLNNAQMQKFSTLAAYGDMDTSGLIAIGASTGGTEAIVTILSQMPKRIPAMLIVQHIPPGFSRAFAQRLNDMCPFEVKEAVDGEVVVPGKVYIAPGGSHMKTVKMQEKIVLRIYDDLPVNRHKPSIDVLFNSLAEHASPINTCGVILTGMGSDGAKGLLKMKQAGMKTLAQDQATSIVFGMPKVALDLGAAEHSLPIGEIANHLVAFLRKHGMAS